MISIALGLGVVLGLMQLTRYYMTLVTICVAASTAGWWHYRHEGLPMPFGLAMTSLSAAIVSTVVALLIAYWIGRTISIRIDRKFTDETPSGSASVASPKERDL